MRKPFFTRPSHASPPPDQPLRRRRPHRAALLALWLPAMAWAGDFAVTPIRVDLDHTNKTGSVTVTNNSADKKLQLQVKLFAWTQDATGKDQYEENADLTYFPRMMTLGPQEPQLLRAGLRAPATGQELAYRLFVEEIPEPRKPDERSAAVAVAIRFGVPVFVKPAQEEPRGEIEEIEVADGKLAVRVRNTGNVHFVVNSIELKGGGDFAKRIEGWYLLPGAARSHEVELDAATCRKLGRIEAKVVTDRVEFDHTQEVAAASCR